ncbi:MAG: hypothetical protein EBY57_09365 [Actinobacteria bacterium]|nr:hypothetical protein [Actinomycetota bacterium]
MELVAALFVENFEMRSAPGPSTRLDITGAMFSQASTDPVPTTVSPHLVALIHCPADESGQGVFEVTFFDHRKTEIDDEEPIARNVSPFTVEPGKFTYRLVRAELPFDGADVAPWSGAHRYPVTTIAPQSIAGGRTP